MFILMLSCFPFRLDEADQEAWAERKAEIEAIWGDTAEEEYVETIILNTARVNWGSSSVILDIDASDVGEARLYWGIVETIYSDSWAGEDCLYGDYLSDDSRAYYCHPVQSTGKTLYYGGNPANLMEGSETVFQQNSGENMTYILDNRYADNGSCWVWGHDISYYDDYYKDCIALD